MDAKLEPRQSQFPASFPDTFKNFFAIMNEDEDQMELFPNLLEDKVIPRKTQFQRRLCGGSLRCPMNPHHKRQTNESDMVHKIGVTGLKVNNATQNNVGRSNSFRFNRPRHNTVSSSSSVLNNLGRHAGICKSFIDSEIDDANGILSSAKFGGSGSYLFCKHMKYCCLHQQPQRKNELHQQQPHSPSEDYDNHSLFQHQPTVLKSLETQQQQQQNFSSKNFQHDCSNIRLGPDGEDNKTATVNMKNGQIYRGPHYQQSNPFYQEANYVPATMLRQYKRPPVTLDQPFNFDVRSEECDSISVISDNPMEMVGTQQQQSHNVLKPILKQPQKNHHQQNQLDTMNNKEQQKVPKSILKDTKQRQNQKHQQQKQHRTLPHPPIDAGLGVFHTKEAALQRVQQQSGLLLIGNTTNISAAAATGTTTIIQSTDTQAMTAERVDGITITKENVLQKPLNSKNYYQTYSNTNRNSNCSDTNSGIGSDAIYNTGGNNTANMNISEHGNFCTVNRSAGDVRTTADYPTMVLQPDISDSDKYSNGTYIDKSNCMESVNSANSEKADSNRGVTFTQNDFHKNLQKSLRRNSTKSNIFSNYPLNKNNSNASIESRGNVANIQEKISPILNRSRSSSITANSLRENSELNFKQCHTTLSRAITTSSLTAGPVNLTTNTTTFYNTNDALQQKREHNNLAVSGNGSKSSRLNMMPLDSSGVLTFQQAMSGAVSPQYLTAYHCSGILPKKDSNLIKHIHSQWNISLGDDNAMATATNILTEDNNRLPEKQITATASIAVTTTKPTFTTITTSKLTKASVISADAPSLPVINSSTETDDVESLTSPIILQERNVDVGNSSLVHGASTTTIAPSLNKNQQKQRMRTSSMPAENRKPRLADTRRAAIHCADLDLEYYRLRSFSITSHGVCNLGDSVRSRRSRSITSVTSTATSNSGKDRHNSNASRTSGDFVLEKTQNLGKADSSECKTTTPGYKIAMLGASGVGKTTLTYQFTTSEYICAYDLSLDDDYGQKTVSVLVDGIETDLEIIDHPACEMSTEAFCSTYNLDLFVVVYSVVDRNSFKVAEKILQYLKENEMLLTRGAILVGNKTDLERHREVNRQMARKLATDVACKFIETSSGLDHNVDELLVGIVAQVKLNPQRIKNLSEKVRQRLYLQNTIQKSHRSYAPRARLIRQISMSQEDNIEHNELEYKRDENLDNTTPNGTDGKTGSGSERTVSTILSSSGEGNSNQAISCTKITNTKTGRKMTKRPLNLENILKMGESEFEDEEDTHLPRSNANKIYGESSQFFSEFELSKSELESGSNSCTLQLVNVSPSTKVRHNIKRRNTKIQFINGADMQEPCNDVTTQQESAMNSFSTSSENVLTDNCNQKTFTKLTNRTKTFLMSVLRFKKALNVAKRRNSSSCSDLFVI